LVPKCLEDTDITFAKTILLLKLPEDFLYKLLVIGNHKVCMCIILDEMVCFVTIAGKSLIAAMTSFPMM